ncbi:MAG: DUF2752 domain-containing protein [Bacteroidales bacterium]|nr:DUF2752 domain-containing protein [Bacteroidales bacterium]
MNKKNLTKIYLGLLLVSPLVLFCLPSDIFDKSTANLCLSKLIFHRECFGCGITRAVMHAIHFEFSIAWAYNKLVVLVIPFLAYLWVDEILRCRKILRKESSE